MRTLASQRKPCGLAMREPQAMCATTREGATARFLLETELSLEQGCSGIQPGACVMKKLNGPMWLAALCLLGGGAYAAAQPKPQAPAPKPEAAAASTICGHDCPMHQVIGRAEVKVEQTKQGAVIQLIAKRPEDVQSLQQGAAQLAAVLSGTAGCPMHQGMHQGMHPGHGAGMHHHRHVEQQPSPKP